MTSAEIRQKSSNSVDFIEKAKFLDQQNGLSLAYCFQFIAEIAAQLAEMNERDKKALEEIDNEFAKSSEGII